MLKRILKLVGMVLLVSLVVYNFGVNLVQNVYVTSKDLEISETLYEFAKVTNKAIGEIVDFNETIAQTLSIHTETMLSNVLEIFQLNTQIKPYIRPNFEKLLNATVVIHQNTNTTAGVCIKEDENSYYILTVAHGVDGISQTNREIAIPESNLGHTIRLEVIQYFLESDVYLIPLQEATNITVELRNGWMRAGAIVKICEEIDLALLKVSKFEHNELEVLEVSKNYPIIGDKVYVIGHPLGITFNLTEGVVSNFNDYIYMVIDSMITFGNSGGAVFNSKGEVIGISSCVPVYWVFEEIEEDNED